MCSPAMRRSQLAEQMVYGGTTFPTFVISLLWLLCQSTRKEPSRVVVPSLESHTQYLLGRDVEIVNSENRAPAGGVLRGRGGVDGESRSPFQLKMFTLNTWRRLLHTRRHSRGKPPTRSLLWSCYGVGSNNSLPTVSLFFEPKTYFLFTLDKKCTSCYDVQEQ